MTEKCLKILDFRAHLLKSEDPHKFSAPYVNYCSRHTLFPKKFLKFSIDEDFRISVLLYILRLLVGVIFVFQTSFLIRQQKTLPLPKNPAYSTGFFNRRTGQGIKFNKGRTGQGGFFNR